MSTSYEFIYFPDFMKWAKLEEPTCQCISESEEQSTVCLTGQFFHNPQAPEAVCLSDLLSGAIRVHIDDWVKVGLENSVRGTHPEWTEDQVRNQIAIAVDTLSRTPPIPWVQNNDWPSCPGDFCRYVGEWVQEDFTRAAGDGDGLAYLMSVIREPEGLGSPAGLWHSIASEWAVVFMFECLTCHRLIAIEQSF